MKKFIINTIMRIITLLIAITIALAVFTYMFSQKSNMSFENTISYFKDVIIETLGIENPSDNPVYQPAEIVKSSTNYYYLQLDDTAKIIYNSLESNIENLKKENYVINFSTTFNDLLHKTSGEFELTRSFQSAINAFFYDHPELFYLDLTKILLNTKCISLGTLKTYTVEISPKDGKNYLSNEYKSEFDVDNAIKKVENARADIINTISAQDTAYEKIKKVHDKLVNSIEYDQTFSKNNIHNIYGALVEKEVVCEGYAKAFKYMLDSLGFECILVSGNATNYANETEPHMWNYVKLDDLWYGVDVTWDDPIIIGGFTSNNLRHTYFLKGYRSFFSSHEPNGKLSDNGMLFILPSLSIDNYKK